MRFAATFRARARGASLLALLIVLSGAAGVIVVHGNRIFGSDLKVPLFALGAGVCAAIISKGPVACVAAIAAFGAAGLHPDLAHIGGANMAIADVFYAATLGWFVVQWLQRLHAPAARKREPAIRFGQGAAALFVVYAGITLLYVASVDPGRLSVSFVSWLRFAQSLSIGWLAVRALRTERDIRITLTALAVGGAVAVGSAIVNFIVDGGSLGDRFGGLQGVNAQGMLGGLLITMGVFQALGPGPKRRAALIFVGALGMLLGKSVGATVGTGLALAIGLGFRMPVPSLQRLGSVLVSLVIAFSLVFGAIKLVRPNATPGSSGFSDSSTSQRAIDAAVGLHIFGDHPIAGVGWRRSDEPSVVSDPSVVGPVREKFQGVPNDLFPDVRPVSVHNTYIQILADLGIIGMALFIGTVLAVGAAIMRLLKKIPPGDPLFGPAWSVSLGLLLVLVWLNDNPLYGGQLETIFLPLGVGMLAVMSRIVARRSERPA